MGAAVLVLACVLVIEMVVAKSITTTTILVAGSKAQLPPQLQACNFSICLVYSFFNLNNHFFFNSPLGRHVNSVVTNVPLEGTVCH